MLIIGILATTILFFNCFYQENFNKSKISLNKAMDNYELLIKSKNSDIEIENLLDKLNESEGFLYFYLRESNGLGYPNENNVLNEILDDEIISKIKNGESSFEIYDQKGNDDFIIGSRYLDNGNYIGVVSALDGPIVTAKKLIPGIISLVFIGIIISLYISERTIDDFIGVLEENSISTRGNTSEINLKYKELYPFVRVIKDQRDDINRHISQMEQYGETLEAILSNMREGMILLDGDLDILALNESAVKLGEIDYYGVNYRGINLKSLLRSEELNQIFEDILSHPNQRHSYDITIKDKIVNLIASPVLNGEANLGFVILLIDETKEKLLELQRKEFSANVSHELKTPLTSISGYAEMMMNGFVKPEDMSRFSEIIFNEGQNLLRMIDDIIKISKLDEEELTLESEEINFGIFIKEIISTLDYKIKEKNIEFNAEVVKDKTYTFNKRLISELVINLVDNGIKYNKYGGKIDFTQKEISPNLIEIRVKDTGMGISQKDQKRIFERFYTVDKSHNKKDSSGLGLSIVKHVVKLMSGSIELNSIMGEGSEFIIRLPVDSKEII